MVVSYHCDNVTQEFEEGQLQVVRTWIEKRDAKIKELESERTDMKKSYDEMKKEYDALKKKCDELKAEMDGMKGKCDALEAELSTRKDSAEINKIVKERRKLEREVATRLDSLTEEDLDKLNNRQLKETLIKANYDFDDLANRSDEAIDGMYAMAIKYHDGKRFEEKKQGLGYVSPNDKTNHDSKDNFDGLDDISFMQKMANQSRNLLFGRG